jgi:hypothetical protein
MEAYLPQSLKSLSLEIANPKSLDELLDELYWYADKQAQLAKKRQQTEIALQWEHRVKAIDKACQILDEINSDELEFLIY